jgi:hypothetical protein
MHQYEIYLNGLRSEIKSFTEETGLAGSSLFVYAGQSSQRYAEFNDGSFIKPVLAERLKNEMLKYREKQQRTK